MKRNFDRQRDKTRGVSQIFYIFLARFADKVVIVMFYETRLFYYQNFLAIVELIQLSQKKGREIKFQRPDMAYGYIFFVR